MEDFEHHEPSAPISVYTIRAGQLVCLWDTTEEGIVTGLRMSREDGDLDDSSPVGIRDREAREWLANPFATGGG